jgi:hypothetical protein
MERQFAFVCDYAVQDNKLHAIGIGWETIYAATLPWIHPTMCFVAGLRGSIAEVGTKTVSLRLIDADGEDVVPPINHQLSFEVKQPQLEGDIRIVLNFANVQFKKYGPYAIHLVVQGHEMGSVSFHVSEIPGTA